MTEREQNYDKAFRLFCGTEDSRPDFLQPFKQKELYAATDAHSMIYISCRDIFLDYNEQDSPNIHAVIPKYEIPNTTIVRANIITVKELESKLLPEIIDEIIIEEKEEECSSCDGAGTHECDCGDEHDCNDCDGSGTIDKSTETNTGKKIENPNKIFRLWGTPFTYLQLNRLVVACKIIGCLEIIKMGGELRSGNLFRCNDCFILIMPFMISDCSEMEITTIL